MERRKEDQIKVLSSGFGKGNDREFILSDKNNTKLDPKLMKRKPT